MEQPRLSVISSRTGDAALAVTEFEGSAGIDNRDAVGYYFRARLDPDDDEAEARIAVLFSGTVFAVKPSAFGLRSSGDREMDFRIFALAAIGDHVDSEGPPAPTAPDEPAFKIECFSNHFQTWADRVPAKDAEIELYLRSHLYWAWRFGEEVWQFDYVDCLRLRRDLAFVGRIARLYNGKLWHIVSQTEEAIVLRADPSLLRDEVQARASGHASVDVPEPEPTSTEAPEPMEPPSYPYVDEVRIAELRSIENAKYDLRKLVAICQELNICHRSQCYHAVAALNRAVLDHVPPIFGQNTFTQVVANCTGGRSVKDTLRRLDEAARSIADGHLHQQIRRSEVLPTRTQVSFANELDVLLAEVVRTLRAHPDTNLKVTTS